MTQILLVESEPLAATRLAQALRDAGMAVDSAHTGPDGLHQLLTAQYDLAILDVMLPGIDGFAILEMLRRTQSPAPVMFLSARATIEDRVRGLELGAEDYLVKPYALSELLARIRVVLRRNDRSRPQREASLFQLGDLTLDLLKHRASRGAGRLALTPKEFSLLTLLIKRAGKVQSRTVIAGQVWDMHFDSDTNVVDVAVKRLRTKLDDPFPVKLLHTVRGAGYVLEVRD